MGCSHDADLRGNRPAVKRGAVRRGHDAQGVGSFPDGYHVRGVQAAAQGKAEGLAALLMTVLGDDHAYEQCLRKRSFLTFEGAQRAAVALNGRKTSGVQAQPYVCHFIADHWHVGRPASITRQKEAEDRLK